MWTTDDPINYVNVIIVWTILIIVAFNYFREIVDK